MENKEYKSMVDYMRETDVISLFEPIFYFFKGFYEIKDKEYYPIPKLNIKEGDNNG